jgi:Tfp pilus assembly protein PilX
MNAKRIKIGNKNPLQKQRGFVLVLAIVLLASLTLIGVSSMNSASIELKAAANEQQHQIAFNAVQSMIEYSISDPVTTGAAPLLDYQSSNEALEQPLTYSNFPNAKGLEAKVIYAGCIDGVEGSSLEEGRAFGFNLYTITATGSNITETAFSQQVQGVRHSAASCNK